jgi:hypothetical protein
MRAPILDQTSLPPRYRIEPEQNEDGSITYAVAVRDGAPDSDHWIGILFGCISREVAADMIDALECEAV